jgi:hypothetical protein
MGHIDISGINKADLLAGLYNASKPQGLGYIHSTNTTMTTDEAQKIIDTEGLSFDYLRGRVMKINLEGDAMNPAFYDRDNGEGAAAQVAETVRSGQTIESDIPSPSTKVERLADSGEREAAIDLAYQSIKLYSL